MVNTLIKVQGIVQGVGFRPYVYNLALQHNLKGYVNNDDSGVNILLQGFKEDISAFLKQLETNPPVLAKIDSLNVTQTQTETFYKTFEIIQSEQTNSKSTIISPDIAVCDDCIGDIQDEKNFRFKYALTNCTNCGPRYSIIKTVPYDRVNTSMNKFIMCESCENEYINPANRRYHAQPVSCEVCGPKIVLFNKDDEEVCHDLCAIEQIATYIKSGNIVAIKGMGGFHIVCDATNEYSVDELRVRKNRPDKPFAVMFKNIDSLKEYAKLTQAEEEIVLSKEKPITLVKRIKTPKLARSVAPSIDRLGVFLPYTPLHTILFEYLENPIVATSANLSNEPIICSKDELLDKLGTVIDYVLDYDRDIINACDDSVVQSINDEIFVMRNARGYAPTSIKLPKKVDKKMLAIGANQKNTIALAFDDNLILSPHIGDLNSISSMDYFKRTIETFKRFYDFEPEVIVCDKHPNYETTKWATYECSQKHIELVQVQHHYAHVLATMAEHKLDEDVLAFAFDGTGYGDDGKIWGGEVFVTNKKEYERIYALQYFKLLGSEKAVREPKRVALSLLFDTFSFEEVLSLDCPTVHHFNDSELKVMHTVWQRELNAPYTSSVGRLFDAVASLAGIAHEQSYEGETGLKLEQLYDWHRAQAYEYEIIDGKLDIKKAIRAMVDDNESSVIATKFINMISNIIVDISLQHKDLPVVLTGGVFQNRTLLELTTKRLEVLEKRSYYSSKVPLNDAGIPVGQLYSQI